MKTVFLFGLLVSSALCVPSGTDNNKSGESKGEEQIIDASTAGDSAATASGSAKTAAEAGSSTAGAASSPATLPSRPIRKKNADGPPVLQFWSTITDPDKAFNYKPDTQNVYHLFTRQNPSVSQVLVPGNDDHVLSSTFDSSRRTAVLIHGWMSNVTTNFNAVMVPAFLDAEDMNVIVVDWCAGACTINYFAVIKNTVASGESVARFITWLSNATGTDATKYHVVGFSLGGQQAGIVGRSLGGRLEYITSLDPATDPEWAKNENKFRATDAIYTEVIHTNAGSAGYLEPLGDVDFYPNGGDKMPGCSNGFCNHESSFHYLAESLRSGVFTGQKCNDYKAALNKNCTLPESLTMGGLTPKTGSEGIYYLSTNDAPPYYRG